ncbi:MAG: hypothetical protein WKG07_16215 [Hymenobacter sp.]
MQVPAAGTLHPERRQPAELRRRHPGGVARHLDRRAHQPEPAVQLHVSRPPRTALAGRFSPVLQPGQSPWPARTASLAEQVQLFPNPAHRSLHAAAAC